MMSLLMDQGRWEPCIECQSPFPGQWAVRHLGRMEVWALELCMELLAQTGYHSSNMLSSLWYRSVMSSQHMLQSLCAAFLIPRQQLMSLMLCPRLHSSLSQAPGEVLQLNCQNTILCTNYSPSKLHFRVIFLWAWTGLFACSFFFLLLRNPCKIFMVSRVSIWEERLFPSIQFLLPLTFFMLQMPGTMSLLFACVLMQQHCW